MLGRVRSPQRADSVIERLLSLAITCPSAFSSLLETKKRRFARTSPLHLAFRSISTHLPLYSTRKCAPSLCSRYRRYAEYDTAQEAQICTRRASYGPVDATYSLRLKRTLRAQARFLRKPRLRALKLKYWRHFMTLRFCQTPS